MTLPRPTDGELALLRVLWDRGPSTVRELHTALATGTAYTTVLRFCQVMFEKGLVTRNEAERQHVYAAAIAESEVQHGLMGDLVDKAFRGSAKALVVRALSGSRPSQAELDEIQALLDQMRGEGKP
jgi:predicted transcriptional regulator